ncbi:unnamed protein product [Linum trigynum]|uniref:Uncharacterized protein n=1 Tax=Linum trigynum TaxID=586398 RepID=A0AAV2FA83_9ROSI
MLSFSLNPDNSPAADLALTGRPPDPSGLQPNPPTGTVPGSQGSTPLSYKTALAGSPTKSPSTTHQWTFIGAHDLEVGSYQGEPELKISAQLRERLCIPWKRTLVVRLLG